MKGVINLERFINKMERLIQQLAHTDTSVLFIKFRYTTYGIVKSSQGKFHIKYYNPPEIYISGDKTFFKLGTFTDEVYNLSLEEVTNWFIANWRFALSSATFTFR